MAPNIPYTDVSGDDLTLLRGLLKNKDFWWLVGHTLGTWRIWLFLTRELFCPWVFNFIGRQPHSPLCHRCRLLAAQLPSQELSQNFPACTLDPPNYFLGFIMWAVLTGHNKHPCISSSEFFKPTNSTHFPALGNAYLSWMVCRLWNCGFHEYLVIFLGRYK